MKLIVIVGNIVDGFNFYGPFTSTEDAIRYAEQMFGQSNWWVTTLYRVKDSE